MDANQIISEINRYSALSGLKQTTICQKVFGNARYLDRLVGRMDRLQEELDRFRAYAAENPPTGDAGNCSKPATSANNLEHPHENVS